MSQSVVTTMMFDVNVGRLVTSVLPRLQLLLLLLLRRRLSQLSSMTRQHAVFLGFQRMPLSSEKHRQPVTCVQRRRLRSQVSASFALFCLPSSAESFERRKV